MSSNTIDNPEQVYYVAFSEDCKELAFDWSEMYESERRDYLEKIILDANKYVHLR